MKLLNKLFILTATAIAISSCQGDLLDTKPYDKASSGSMWSNENFCTMGVASIYATLREGYVAKEAYLMEAFSVGATCRDNDYPLLAGTASIGSGIFSDYWKQHYAGIYRANDAIVHLPDAPISESVKGKLLSEAKVLRAFYYYKLNAVFRGVPYYNTPMELDQADKPRESEENIWNFCIQDLTDAINDPNFPDRIAAGKAEWGHVTKSVAYALRGKIYLWTKEWSKAEADFRKVGELGHSLFQDGYKQLFKEANEQSDEAIFSLQCIDNNGSTYGNSMSFRYGGRTTFGSCWNTMLGSVDFVETYENIDGSKFNWDEYIPGFSSLDIKDREVFFLRNTDPATVKAQYREIGFDGTEEALDDMVKKIKAKVDGRLEKLSDKAKALYLPAGNEARIKAAYDSRDPRLAQTVITPYATYDGSGNSVDHTFTSRWPYYGADTDYPYDLRTDTQSHLYYLFRKFVAEGSSEMTNREQSPIDLPIIRYATVVIGLAEALNEQGKTDEAIEWLNKVRQRAGVALLNSNTATMVQGQEDMRVRIQNEFRWETVGEGVDFYEELRWKTWKESKFNNADGTAGMKDVWGTNREQSPIDLPIIRYATVVIGLAEALNEQGKTDEAIEWLNKVRQRAGVALLNSNTATMVQGQEDMRVRIQNEFRWETVGEGVDFYEELRWKTWKESKFNNADGTAGMKDVWGTVTYPYTWGGDQYYVWPIPKHETDMNKSLTQNSGWN